ncbi:biotin transporter BioY [Fictibacillus sp. KU28468]|uniref:biotin transporter BioY n=1 Tax=Fictibacillus sp. KU28468 TaxID=2991053 RepID=UPI0008E8E07C|nr:biotin transporter BioY [Fictibacillus sp. KU28468]UZJ80068.1 biotin transporter BioY [Fictibacillus sp. KU28468]SFD51158.1 biotin transport system substrate-specific component [Bacillus sp. OV194]
MKFRAIDLTLAAMFAALMAVGGNITAWIPALVFGQVPVTLQTFFCILAGLLLGSRLGAVSMIVYTLVGLAGAPVFAGFSGGPSIIFKPTFGFILSFILAAYVAGKILEMAKKPSLPVFFLASFAGLIVNYFVGTTFLYAALTNWASVEGVTYLGTWKGMLLFLPKDVILTAVTAVISPRIYKAVAKNRRSTSNSNAA